MLIRYARLVPVGGVPAPDGPVDIAISGGVVRAVTPSLGGRGPGADEPVVDAGGRWVIPGLWDQHVHMLLWSQTRARLDLAGSRSPAAVLEAVAGHLAGGLEPGALVQGYGFRSATWSQPCTVAGLDAVCGDHPVILTSADAHTGWLSSAALALLGLPPRAGQVSETEWFALQPAIAALTSSEDVDVRPAVADAAARGVVGIVDVDFAGGLDWWTERFATGIDLVRVRAACYPEGLDDVVAAGRAGAAVPGTAGLLTMGPLKIISDGSLNTRSAHCCEPYADGDHLDFPRGRQLRPPAELASLLRRADQHGLETALHAVGDAAVGIALDAFAETGAAGSIEHAQLVRRPDIVRMARLGIRASVQPAHLLDDRDVTEQCWPDRADRCFPLRSMLDAGVTLALGSDAPVARLDPWLAMAAAVHRAVPGREAWHPAESITAAEALAASTDGQTTVAVGSRADLVVLDDDPLADDPDASRLRTMSVAATVVAGRITHAGERADTMAR